MSSDATSSTAADAALADAAALTPDAVVPVQDAASPPPPDAAAVTPDAAAVTPDAGSPPPSDAAVLDPDALPPPPLPDVCREIILGFETCFPRCAGAAPDGACAAGLMCVDFEGDSVCVSDCRQRGCSLRSLVCNGQTGYCAPPEGTSDLGRACESTDDCASCCRWRLTQLEPADLGDPYFWTCDPVRPGTPGGRDVLAARRL